ncbi:unnamed protein product [Phytophthora fragariaefolia]|uniref:Unnamed protein product n=1 Tax=Phytophthora fragariaefolia TaxID=1490495 RepID=A0A9W6XBP0_9STRA|nr:unnamed protein product [Phytophthora fragariaefolia]
MLLLCAGDSSESESDVEPTNVVVADGPSDAEEKDEDNEESEDEPLLDFTQTDYAVQMSQVEPPAEDDDEEGGGRKANKEPTKPKAVQQLSEKVRCAACWLALNGEWRR